MTWNAGLLLQVAASLLLTGSLVKGAFVPGHVDRQMGVVAKKRWNLSSLMVVSEPRPFQGMMDQGMMDQDDDNDDVSSSNTNNNNLQPIRRLRRDKKEPLIAIVGRPNVVR